MRGEAPETNCELVKSEGNCEQWCLFGSVILEPESVEDVDWLHSWRNAPRTFGSMRKHRQGQETRPILPLISAPLY